MRQLEAIGSFYENDTWSYTVDLKKEKAREAKAPAELCEADREALATNKALILSLSDQVRQLSKAVQKMACSK